MTRNLILILALLTGVSGFVFGQSFENNGLIRSGNRAFHEGDTLTAIENYNEALIREKGDYRASFNKALVTKSMNKPDEALTLYESLSKQNIPLEDKAAAYYNLGNLAFEKQELEKSLEYFKECLRLTPQDQDAKYNYFLVKKMLEQQQEQEQNQDQQNEDQDQSEDQENQENDQQEQDNENQDQQDQDDQSGDQGEQQDEKGQEQEDSSSEGEQEQNEQQESESQNQSGQQGDESGEEQEGQAIQLSKEEAKRLLEALENQEKEIQARLLQKKPKKSNKKPEKDW